MPFNLSKFKSIHTRTLVIIIAAIVVFFVLNIGTIMVTERRVLMDRAMENSLKLSNTRAENVGLLIDNSAKLIVGVAQDSMMRDIDKAKACRILSRLISLDKDLYRDAVYIKRDSVYNVEGIEQRNDMRTYYNRMLTLEDDYQVVDIINYNADVPSFAISAPIRDEAGEIVAAIAFLINIEEFSKRIERHDLEEGSFVWVIDNYGTIIAHPNDEYPLKVNIADAEVIGMEGFSNISAAMMREDEGVGVYYDKNIDQGKIVTFARIPNTPGWKLNVTTLDYEIYGHIPGMINQVILITFILSIVFILVANWLVRTIMEPLTELTNGVERSVENNFEPISVQCEYEEVNKLIVSYNQMTDEIKNYTQGLERLVEERTKKLNVMNSQLNQQNRHLNETIISLNEVSRKDALTGLFNRSMLYKYLDEVINDLEIGLIEEAALFFLDLDNFKYYNDTFGHDLGDKILLEVTDVFKKVLRKGDFIARYGGDEFVIVLKSVSASDAKKIKLKIKMGISDMIANFVDASPGEFIGHKEKASTLLGISVGLVHLNPNYLPSIDELLIEADAMMYSEKQHKK